jgi:transmembrane sensor
MGNSNYFDELIVSYLSNELNTEEEAFVLDWINSSQQNRQYFEELRSAWKLLAIEQNVKDIDVDFEWNRFRKAIIKEQQEPAFINSVNFDHQIIEELKTGRKARFSKLFMSTAVAASILLAISLAWRFSTTKTTNEKPLSDNVKKEIRKPHLL